MTIYDTREGARLIMNREKKGHWNQWGPYLSARGWGTVREDYSAGGDAWSYFPHDHARSRAFRWSEDGLLGICDDEQLMCFALALWNGADPILKERPFGLTGSEGNHGEDVKEYWYYLDSTPTHSYMKAIYKYPQAPFPYQQLIEENQRRGKHEMEYELLDTGVFDEGRYFDVVVEYAKAASDDLLIRVTVSNRGPDDAPIWVLPTLWFRNRWSWGDDIPKPAITAGKQVVSDDVSASTLLASQEELGDYILYCANADELLFTENETNVERLYGTPSPTHFVKDAFHAYVIAGQQDAVNPAHSGTKAAPLYKRTVGAGESITIQLRLSAMVDGHPHDAPFADFDALIAERQEEAEEFYDVVLPAGLSDDARLVARQAFAGMLWSKQYYHFVVSRWLEGDAGNPPPPASRLDGRNHNWDHLYNRDVITMPDTWEFPWYASWDLGFHCATIAHVDPQFAKDQIILMLREWYMHPNGQIPAYEWNFEDVNPPVLPIAALRVFEIERKKNGVADYDFLERVFQKMMLNFTWWVNRKDVQGDDVFQGGFLGMDNIGPFDRGKLPTGYLLGQADGTSWMATFSRSMFGIALILAQHNPVYEDVASKFWEHFVYIANAMNSQSNPEKSLWNEEDSFFYDHIIAPDGERLPVRTRTMVGFVPLFGATTVPASIFDAFPEFKRRQQWFIKHRPHLMESVKAMIVPGPNDMLTAGLVRPDQLQSMLQYMLDETEFLSHYGIRAVSRYHKDHPFVIRLGDEEFRLDYEPGESETDLFGGNSNWRGPIWMPVNFLIIGALERLDPYYGDEFKVECPVGSGRQLTLYEVAAELARRLAGIFLRSEDGRRPVFGENQLFNNDPYWRDLINFHEYFHGDSGRGCGASHQTGWTGLIADLMIRFAETDPS